MGILVVVVVLAFLGGLVYLVMLGAGGLVVISSVGKSVARREAAISDAPRILGEKFVGERVTVYFDTHTLPFDAWVQGADERGYRLIGQALDETSLSGTLVFARS